jgi:presenilin-like A22 family membrane protease
MKLRIAPFFWGTLVMAVTFTLGLFVAVHQKVFVEQQGIGSPNVAPTPAIAYFLVVVAVLVLVLFLIPISKLKYLFRVLFTVMYAWGALILVWLLWPSHNAYVVYAIALGCGLLWLLWTRIWLQNILLMITLGAMGSVFGFFFMSPWAFIIVMAAISIYDFLAVRSGLMVWMADKMSETTTLPAFIFPKDLKDWRLSVHAVDVNELSATKPEEREYSILGGGDVAFPLMLAASVFFQKDIKAAAVVAVFAVIGLMAAYLIQAWWLKGKPIPALPPITAFSIIGFLITWFFM